MKKIAIIVLADTETFEGLGRVVNGLEAARELTQAGHSVEVIFDGAGTRWVGKLSSPEHRAHALYTAVRDRVTGACSFCAGAFGVADEVKSCGVRLVDEHAGHPSVRRLVEADARILTY